MPQHLPKYQRLVVSVSVAVRLLFEVTGMRFHIKSKVETAASVQSNNEFAEMFCAASIALGWLLSDTSSGTPPIVHSVLVTLTYAVNVQLVGVRINLAISMGTLTQAPTSSQ